MGLTLPKQFAPLAGLPLLVRTLRAFEQATMIDAVVVAAPAAHLERVRDLLARFHLRKVGAVVPGGRLRQDSVRAGLEAVSPETEWVAVHDGARPLVSPELICSCLSQARLTGAAMAAVPVKDTLKAVGEQGEVSRTVDRHGLWQAQTPQVMRAGDLRRALAAAVADGFVGTDEASLLERIGVPVAVVEGSEKNLKVTRPEDLLIAEALLRQEENGEMATTPCETAGLRIGHGYDAHRLIPGRPLVLGGVAIPHALGLLGHSDADVLTHALCDALLGALGQGDIGRHFPDSDERYRGILSLELLREVMALTAGQGFRLVNADVTVIAQQPKLAPYFPEMQKNLAAICTVGPAALNLKASTTEKMGFAGREEGIAAHAVVLLASGG